jgi:hypothetical protein
MAIRVRSRSELGENGILVSTVVDVPDRVSVALPRLAELP